MGAAARARGGNELIAWITVAVFGFYTAYTLFEVPHMALGAELTQERRDRVRVFAARQFVRTLGLFAAFGLGAALLEDLATARDRLAVLAGTASVLTVASILWAIVALPRERPDYAGRGPGSSWRAARDVWRNRDARILLFVYGIEQLGMGGIGVLVPFIVRHVLREPDLIAEMLLCYTVPALASVPVWMWLGERFDKRTLWMRAMGLSGIGFGMLLFLAEGRVALMVASSLVAGCASGCAPTLGQALKADVIDRDELATGERKEGAYFAAWSLVSKVASGIMIGLVGFSLDLSGFVAGVEEQSETAVRAMTLPVAEGCRCSASPSACGCSGASDSRRTSTRACSRRSLSGLTRWSHETRQDLADRPAQHGVGERVHLGRLGVQDHDARAGALRDRHDARDRIDGERGADREQQIAALRRALRAPQILHHEALSERDRRRLEDSAAAPARGILLARAHARERALDRRALVALHAHHLAQRAVDLDDRRRRDRRPSDAARRRSA